MKLIYYFIDKHRLTNLISLMILLLGFLSLKSTNVDLIPSMSFKGIEVYFNYPEATAGDIEEYVVFPFEAKILNFPGLKSFSSTSYNGKAQVSLNFPADYKNIISALSEVKEIIEELRPLLPQGIRFISVKERKKTRTFQNYIKIENYTVGNVDHENLLKGFKNKIQSIRGIIDVSDSTPKKKLIIDFKEKLLKQKEITITEALGMIRRQLRYVPLGSIKKGNKKTIIEFQKYNQKDFLENISSLPIKTNAFGYTTTLKDVANIKYTFEEPERMSFKDKKVTNSLRVLKDTNSDVIKNDAKVRELLKEFNENTFGVKAKSVVSGKGFIVRQLKALKSNGLFGVVLVIILLVLFLSFRSALCTAWGVPIAYAGTLVIIFMAGMSINLLSIVGLIIIAGILVDDALIVTEKYNEELNKGITPEEAARNAIKELFVPVLGTALTTVMAFLPLILIPSELGSILISIPIVIIGALVFSIFESFFILPSHLVSFDRTPKQGLLEHKFNLIKTQYSRFIKFTLKYKYPTVFFFLTFSVFSIIYSMDIEKNFNLNIGDEVIMVRGALKNSSSKQETLEKIEDLYAYVKELTKGPEFSDLGVGVGKLWNRGSSLVGDQYFDIRANLNEGHPSPDKIKKPIEKKLKKFLKEFKEKNDIFEFVTFQKGFASGEEDSKQQYLSVDFYTKSSGANLDLKNILKDLPSKVKGLGEIELGDDSKKISKWVFDPDFKLLAQLGVTKDQVKDSLLGKVQTAWLGESRINGEALIVATTVNGKSVEENDFNPKEQFVITGLGNKIALSTLGTWSKESTSEEIKHLNAYKIQTAKFPIQDSKKRDEIVKNSKVVLKSIEKSYPQHIIKSSGESLEEAENKAWILKSLVACLIGIYFVLVLVLGSLLQPFIVCLPILFGIIGVLLAHKLHGMSLGILSGIGLIGAIGVSVNGSLVMADQINSKLKDKAKDAALAIEEGALSRFRAILLTSLTTLGGLFPMAYGLGGDAGFTKALAFSMSWGILLSSILTLFFFPAIFAFLHQVSTVWFRRKKKSSV